MSGVSPKKWHGYIQVYTGNGKGKTTAAIGLAVRAAGYGYCTYIGQFLKGRKYGELNSLAELSSRIVIKQFGRNAFIHVDKNPEPEDIAKAMDGLESCRAAMLSGQYRLVILDEINVAVYFNLIEEATVLKLMEDKPGNVELVLTGRYAPESFIHRADLVTEMKEIKHYYARQISARDGIER
jgi:cob(I)alamin adenosyltransferase